MKKNLSNIIDLDKYPIQNLKSPKIKTIVEKCKIDLNQDSCATIPNFILPNSLKIMREELEQQLDEVFMSKESINAYLYAKDDPGLPIRSSKKNFYE
tara:strand:- start:227 stop:517 length:291 start_codon:yes stop_codon:yes gene_type:complete